MGRRDPLAVVLIRGLPGPTAPSFELAHPYLEVVYGPLLGPTAVVLARALDRKLGDRTEVEVDFRMLTHELGLRGKPSDDAVGSRSSVVRALDRLEHMSIVRLNGDVVEVCRSVPPVPDGLLGRLPREALVAHERYTRVP